MLCHPLPLLVALQEVLDPMLRGAQRLGPAVEQRAAGVGQLVRAACRAGLVAVCRALAEKEQDSRLAEALDPAPDRPAAARVAPRARASHRAKCKTHM